MDFDVVIIGGGPAGTAAALRLLASGLSVLIIERPNHPTGKPCAGGLTIKTMNLLPHSVAPVIERAVSGLAIGVHSAATSRIEDLPHADPICAFAVRAKFDAFNLDKATRAGAEFVTATVERIEQGADEVVATAGRRSIRSRYLIGADGANSVVRRLTSEGRWFSRGFAIEGVVPHAALGGEPGMELLFGFVADGYGWLFPKGDHVNLGIYTRNAAVPLSKERLLKYAKLRLGTDRVEAIRGFPLGFGGVAYRATQPRVVLAGDAAGLAEPLLGEGLHNAVRGGQAAADAIVDVERLGIARSLAASHHRRLRPVMKDLARSQTLARLFYPRLRWFAPALLRRSSVGAAFLNGFAAGRTLREITDRFFFPPPYRPAAPLSLREFFAAREKGELAHRPLSGFSSMASRQTNPSTSVTAAAAKT